MANIHIRSVTAAAAAAWARLRQELWPKGDDTHRREAEQFFRDELAEPLAVLFAEADRDQVVAFVELSIRSNVEGCSSTAVGYVEGLYVLPDWRNQGVARALLRAPREWAEQRGCREFASDRADRVILGTLASFPAASQTG